MDQPNVVLPKELRLGAPATMPQSRSYMFKQQAALNNYAPRDTIQINLPRLQRSYLTKDSYLEFEVEFKYIPNNAEVGLMLDTCGAFGLIDRIEVYDYLGSTQLESTAGFGQLMCLLQDSQRTTDEFNFHGEVTQGAQSVSLVADWERYGATSTHASGIDARFTRPMPPIIGEIIDMGSWKDTKYGASVQTLTETRTLRRKYHIPLFSFLGLLSPKYAPLHNGYTIMITLQTSENALGSVGINVDATGASYTEKFGTDVAFKVTNARMCCQILELGPIAESMLLSTTGQQPMIVPTKAYRNYNSSVTAGSSTFKLDLNINVASLTNVMWIMRPSAWQNSTKYNSLSARQRNFLESWYFQYGSSILPQTQGITAFKPINNEARDYDLGSECLIEFMKSRHMYNQPDHKHVFNKYNWAYDNATRFEAVVKSRHHTKAPTNQKYFTFMTPDTYLERGKFACGLDLELVSGRTNEIICGMNTNGMNTAIFATFNAKAASQTATSSDKADYFEKGVRVEDCKVDAWCEYDAFINISPGIATTVSF